GATGIGWNGTGISGTGTSKTTTTSASTYRARVRAYLTAGGTTCYSGYSTFTVGTVYSSFTAGSITTASDTTMAGTDPGITITNATPASGGDENITYQWRRSGTSLDTLSGSAATYSIGTAASNYTGGGTYIFKRYAHDGTCNTSWEESSGQYTLTVIVLCPPNSIGACTWTYGPQIWSGILIREVAGCEDKRRSSLSSDDYPPAQYYSSGNGYYYNWTCVNTYATILCPSPWRVPTLSDFNTLLSYTNAATLSSDWGLPGLALVDIRYVGTYGRYWSSTGVGDDPVYAYNLQQTRNVSVEVNDTRTYFGFPVRCVRDAP
ncbi:MAG: hypothetical protein LBD91_01990, partial [Prevotellaceae bacterium]|nr:hypothetical protein [Prevotellaceae bacterium]